MPDFRKLMVWQKARALEMELDRVMPLIRRRRARLADQTLRAAESISACIAEGRGRSTDRDFAHYVSMAIGSATELEHHLQRVRDLGYIAADRHLVLTESVIEVRRMLIGLRRRLTGS